MPKITSPHSHFLHIIPFSTFYLHYTKGRLSQHSARGLSPSSGNFLRNLTPVWAEDAGVSEGDGPARGVLETSPLSTVGTGSVDRGRTANGRRRFSSCWNTAEGGVGGHGQVIRASLEMEGGGGGQCMQKSKNIARNTSIDFLNLMHCYCCLILSHFNPAITSSASEKPLQQMNLSHPTNSSGRLLISTYWGLDWSRPARHSRSGAASERSSSSSSVGQTPPPSPSAAPSAPQETARRK